MRILPSGSQGLLLELESLEDVDGRLVLLERGGEQRGADVVTGGEEDRVALPLLGAQLLDRSREGEGVVRDRVVVLVGGVAEDGLRAAVERHDRLRGVDRYDRVGGDADDPGEERLGKLQRILRPLAFDHPPELTSHHGQECERGLVRPVVRPEVELEDARGLVGRDQGDECRTIAAHLPAVRTGIFRGRTHLIHDDRLPEAELLDGTGHGIHRLQLHGVLLAGHHEGDDHHRLVSPPPAAMSIRGPRRGGDKR